MLKRISRVLGPPLAAKMVGARRNVEFADAVMVYWGFWPESLQSFYRENRLH